MWQFYRGVQRLATKNKCLLSFQTNRACSSNTAASGLPQEAPPPTKQEIAEISKQIPIEKKSLSSGLAVNKFEKDFVIYPEYEHALEIERIKKFVDELGSDLDKALVPESESSPGTMSPEVRQILLSYGVFASTVSQDFGGPGLGQKDMLQVSECLGGRDLSTFTSFNHVQMASNLIDQYGSLEQKERYLRGIANGKWRPTICYQEDTTGITPIAQVMSAPGQQDRLMTTKVNVVDAVDANLFIVFANQQRSEIIIPSCYIIEKDAIDDPNASIQVKDQVKTSGLRRCNFSTVVFDNVPVDESLLLGEDDKVENLVEEIAYMRKTHCGAATVGFLKKVLAEICTFANTEVKGNLRLSDSHPVQKAIYDLGIQLYVLESASYYIAGLTDESLFLVQDIENSIIQKLSNQALRQAIMTITEVAGICSTDTELPYDKMIKDALAFMSLSEPDLHLVRRITLPAIEHYVNHYGGMKQFVKASAVTKWFTGRDDLESFLNPKFVHFIAEHVHPSLMDAARNFEFSIAQLSQVIDTLVTQKGVYINTDYVALQNISTIMENNLAMIATIARASRAYSIGVRNSDLEIDWTRFFCWKASEEVKKIILNTRELQTAGLFTPNPKLHTGAQSMLDMNGYSLESPIERNW